LHHRTTNIQLNQNI